MMEVPSFFRGYRHLLIIINAFRFFYLSVCIHSLKRPKSLRPIATPYNTARHCPLAAAISFEAHPWESCSSYGIIGFLYTKSHVIFNTTEHCTPFLTKLTDVSISSSAIVIIPQYHLYNVSASASSFNGSIPPKQIPRIHLFLNII